MPCPLPLQACMKMRKKTRKKLMKSPSCRESSSKSQDSTPLVRTLDGVASQTRIRTSTAGGSLVGRPTKFPSSHSCSARYQAHTAANSLPSRQNLSSLLSWPSNWWRIKRRASRPQQSPARLPTMHTLAANSSAVTMALLQMMRVTKIWL